MRILARILATLIGAMATFYFVGFFGAALLIHTRLLPWLAYLVAAVVAIPVARYVWVHMTSRPATLTQSILLSALLTGAGAFAAGFFGPILLTPTANQGPLLGLFITGPLGFILGALGGGIYWLARDRRVRGAAPSNARWRGP
jgi:hypothetical protein